MPGAVGNKRVKVSYPIPSTLFHSLSDSMTQGISIFRPFVFGNIARPIDDAKRPEGVPAEHSHQWTVWVKGVDDEDISYWLKKVQFKLHETYANSVRTIEHPPYEVTETGWGEFEMTIKLFFIPEASEKPQTIYHTIKIHPFGPDADKAREERRPVLSQNYEEVVFNEPVEPFYEILTGAGPAATGKGGKGAGGKGSKQAAKAAAAAGGKEVRTAEIPARSTRENQFSRETEGKELDRMRDAWRKVDESIAKDREKLSGREAMLETLRRSEGLPVKKK
ncbi:MAG: NuA4 histone H4 acetyltransferase complex and the SWR1 complex subunit [Piccolia ochrophora]|nr:MAG: NuA4 histone H4 acetyltransferase complex and the SWR1 complex subunit [Piccolia ochrophora]